MFFNRNPFLQLREGVRIEIGYFLELFLRGRGGGAGISKNVTYGLTRGHN